MMRSTRRLLILAALLLGLGFVAAPQAQAGWWHGCGYNYGYYGWGYTSCYSPCWAPVCAPICRPVCSVSVCDPYCGGWYLGVRPGPIRRAVFGPYRWYPSYGCCSVCYADPCCCYDSCCVSSSVSSTSSGASWAPAGDVQSTQKPTLAPPPEAPAPAPAAGTPNEPAPAPAPAPAQTFAPLDASSTEPAPAAPFNLDTDPAPLGPIPIPDSPSNDSLLPDPSVPGSALDPLQGQGVSLPAGEGTISILVPDGAQVTINGYVTKSTGRVRRYVAQDLKPGLVYPFNIQVSVVRDGRTLSDARQVKLTGGSLEAVVFNFDKTSVDRVAQAW